MGRNFYIQSGEESDVAGAPWVSGESGASGASGGSDCAFGLVSVVFDATVPSELQSMVSTEVIRPSSLKFSVTTDVVVESVSDVTSCPSAGG
jgi:hypothetical protein